VKFTDDNKQVKEFENNWLDFGVHEVIIGLVELGQTDAGQEYLEITVIGPNDEEDTARVWFTTDKAANYSFNVMRQIYVHNAPEAKKDQARQTFDKVADTQQLEELMQKLVGKGKCWFSKYPSPTRTYTAQDGTVKKSIDKNVYGYKPKEHPELLPKDSEAAKKDGVTIEDLGGEPATGDAAANIPEEW
jgi:hypothetical protein